MQRNKAVLMAILTSLAGHAEVYLRNLYPAPGAVALATTYLQAGAEAVGGAAVLTHTFTLTVNGSLMTNAIVIGSPGYRILTWHPAVPFDPGSTVSVAIHVEDDQGGTATTNYSFVIAADSSPPEFVALSPSSISNDAKRIMISVTAQDNTAMSNTVALFVNGTAVPPTYVSIDNRVLQCAWQSALMPVSADWPVVLTVWDIYGNAASTQWLFHSTTTDADFRELSFSNLSPAPAMGGAPPLAPVSARILTRIDRAISNVVLNVDGAIVQPYIMGNDEFDKTIVYMPAMPYPSGARIPVTIEASDGTVHQTSWWFEVAIHEETHAPGVVMLNLWPRYAGPSQDIQLAWAHMRAGHATLLCGTATVYSSYHLASHSIYTATLAASNRAAFGMPATGSNVLTAVFAGDGITQVTEYVHYLVDDLAAYQKGTKGYTGTPDYDGDSIWIAYKSQSGDVPLISGRTIEVEGGPAAALSIRVRAAKGGPGDGHAEIERIVARHGLKQLALKGASVAEVYAPSGTIAAVMISGGNLGRSNVVAIAADQVNGLFAASGSVRVQGGSIFGDILLYGVPPKKPPVIACSAKKNPLTKLLAGGTLFNASIRTEQSDIGAVSIRGGAGFVVAPDIYRRFRMYGVVLAGVSTNYVPDGVYTNIVPTHAIRTVQLKTGRLMGSWVTRRTAKHKITAYQPLREDIWFVDQECLPQWNGK